MSANGDKIFPCDGILNGRHYSRGWDPIEGGCPWLLHIYDKGGWAGGEYKRRADLLLSSVHADRSLSSDTASWKKTFKEFQAQRLRPERILWLFPGNLGRLSFRQPEIFRSGMTNHHGIVVGVPLRESHRLSDGCGCLHLGVKSLLDS